MINTQKKKLNQNKKKKIKYITFLFIITWFDLGLELSLHSWIGGALEVETQRSTIGLLHGNTGQWIVPPANNLTSLFTTISNASIDCK